MGSVKLDIGRYEGDDPKRKLVDELQQRFKHIVVPNIYVSKDELTLQFNEVKPIAVEMISKDGTDIFGAGCLVVDHFSCVLGHAGGMHDFDEKLHTIEGYVLTKVHTFDSGVCLYYDQIADPNKDKAD